MGEDWRNYLPSWAKYDDEHDEIVIDPDVVYPMFLKKLAELDPEQYANKELTQFMVEDARLTATRWLKKIMYEHGGTFLNLRILNRPKWALKNFKGANEGVAPTNRMGLAYALLGLNEPIRPPAKMVHKDLN